MLDGITVLNSYEVVTKTAFSWPSFWIGVSIIAVAVLIVAFFASDSLEDFLVTVGTTVGIVGLLMGLLCGKVLMPKPVEYTAEYEVIISDDVSMNDFYNRYNIIEQRGEIYMIREKEHE